ncbi:hypothetical protein [Paracidobacterium acidisoli]|uniref:hypothetical protein n=1 Tax=Paracidobacterium acidisoli TaxID=2303751 RepID=UPI0011C18D38|nr:hypothetical protein [Paracidobacterium acidisoli]MBT9329577.1 hypothetical protein [Paracidobacterium acidisoli]
MAIVIHQCSPFAPAKQNAVRSIAEAADLLTQFKMRLNTFVYKRRSQYFPILKTALSRHVFPAILFGIPFTLINSMWHTIPNLLVLNNVPPGRDYSASS